MNPYILIAILIVVAVLRILIIAMPFVICTMRRSIEKELDEIEKEIQKLKDFEFSPSDAN